MGKFDGKKVVVTETRLSEENHGEVIKKEIKSIKYEEKNDKCYKRVKYVATYEDGTTSKDLETFIISKDEFDKIAKL